MRPQLFTFFLAITILWNGEVSAFWGNDAPDSKSGLNVAAGYDVNTTTTLTGTVLTLPDHKGQEQHTEMSFTTARGTVTAVLGPWWYWEKNAIPILKNNEVAITGSLAQGKDGALYIFAQRIENRSNAETITLRSESGKPMWSRSGSEKQRGSDCAGNNSRPASGNRGNGMRNRR